MAIRSALSYIINEEQDGFVSVDFDFINGRDEVGADHHDLTAWELVDADVYDCSSIGDKSDDVSETVDLSSLASDAETIAGDVDDRSSIGEMNDDVTESDDVSSECFAETIAGDVDERSSIGDNGDDVNENFDFSVSLNCDVWSERLDCGDANSVPEFFISPVSSHGTNAGEDAKSVTESIMSMAPEYMSGSHYELNAVNGDSAGVEKYCYEEEEDLDLEEDDYDLDDELVPYYVNGKLGRERMRKLGKRSCSKSVKSKRLTYNYNKAGCFRGKHGLGLKHSLI